MLVLFLGMIVASWGGGSLGCELFCCHSARKVYSAFVY